MVHEPAEPTGAPRDYRRIGGLSALRAFEVRVEETDLWVQADADYTDRCRGRVLTLREGLTRFIRSHPGFLHAMTPWVLETPAPELVRTMAAAAVVAGVGPMAAVAGAIAEAVGTDLLTRSGEVIVENGGDIFLRLNREAVVGLFAGPSPLSMRIGLRVAEAGAPLGICTSSATVGHSLSLGRADAACILSASTAFADAAATATANRVRHRRDIPAALEWAKSLPGVLGVVVVKGDRIGVWGAIEVVPLQRKRG